MFFGGRGGKGTITNHLRMTVTCVHVQHYSFIREEISTRKESRSVGYLEHIHIHIRTDKHLPPSTFTGQFLREKKVDMKGLVSL
jgi:hypothetical protein